MIIYAHASLGEKRKALGKLGDALARAHPFPGVPESSLRDVFVSEHSDSHLVVVGGMPDDLAFDHGTDLGELVVGRHPDDLREPDRVRNTGKASPKGWRPMTTPVTRVPTGRA
ncbi:hypothetical protein [Nonomuraea coxensis]|uniref:hypothetical protein n=1 Tax=Nonomuraea coxensis TaxID=404386 RepID=UPI00036A2E5B|nr:hypothetical protein [Nonomuraea coxensis]